MKRCRAFGIATLLIALFVLASALPALTRERPDLPALQGQVQSLRALNFKSPVKAEYFSAAQLKAYIDKAVKAPEQAARMASEDASLKAFGLLDEGFDTAALYIKLYSEQAMGIYDYDAKRLIVVTDQTAGAEGAQAQALGINLEDTVIIHELDHALQDQYFNLGALVRKLERSTGDQALAGQAVFEGDATYVMMEHMLSAVGLDMASLTPDMMAMIEELSGSMGQKGVESLPLYFKKVSLYPYTAGLGLVKHVKDASGWGAVNRLYAALPASTEQVLHPEKYQSGELPSKITFPPLPLQGWKLLVSDTLGEFVTAIVFEQFGAGTKDAAAGWNGDAYQVFRRGQATLLVWYTCWDATSDAERFFRGYRDLLSKKYPGLAWPAGASPDEATGTMRSGAVAYVAKRGSCVVVIEGAAQSDLKSLAGAVFSAKVGR